jgi:hypothetical protein
VATRTASDIYATLLAAGFTPGAATTMTAIALAESGGNPAALGDQGLQTATWGPSYGLFQVRTLKAETGKGTDRDIRALAGSDLRQAQAAYAISSGGTNFSPWSVWKSGSYRDFLGQAKAAAGSSSSSSSSSSGGVAGWMRGVSGKVRDLSIEGLVVVLGLGLVGAGIVRATGAGRRLRSVVGGVL